MDKQQTPGGIDYTVDPMKQGDIITLSPHKSKHTPEQVREAHRWLYARHAVLPGGVLITWVGDAVRILNPVQ